ncbi:SAF domain-containing protein [Psychromonas sp. SP041]|uniref:SAF domain-containing protein n=1 Tax=Psychromonas sp. SP041 TaxID=1365007 RepID=UPI0004047261|nr:SAF domain-containing protein [Psychromonas sp. SP041]
MKVKLTGSATGAMLLFTASGMLASVLGIRQIDKMSTVSAWTVSSHLESGQVITQRSLKKVRIDQDDVSGTIQNPRQLMGKTLKVNKQAGSAIYPSDLKVKEKRSLSQAIPSGRVLYTLEHVQKGMPYGQMSDGDRFDVVVRSRNGVRTVARDIQLIGINYPAAKKADDNGLKNMLLPKKSQDANQPGVSLIVAIRPSDVHALTSIRASDTIAMIFHSAHDIAQGTQLNIDPKQRFRNVEMVAGIRRSNVRVNQ